MEFDANISRLQGCLLSLESRGVLNQSEGIGEAVTALKAVFGDLDKETEARMVFFMVLNTELNVTEQLKDDMNVGLFVDACPKITKSSLIDLLFGLGLDSYLKDLIYNLPGVIVVEILEILTEKLNDSTFHKKQFRKCYLYEINQGIFAKAVEVLNKATDSAVKLVDYFEKLLKLTETVIVTSAKLASDETISFIGEQYYYYFEFLLFCLTLYKKRELNLEKNEIYEISVDFKEELIEVEKDLIDELLYNHLLNHTEEILKALTLDIWMTWSDYNLFDKNETIQQVIGGLAFKIMGAVEELNIKIPEMIKCCLNNLKIKPITEDDIISKASIDEIILKINEENNKSRYKWVKSLISRNFLENEEASICLMKNLEIINSADLNYLIDECLKNLEKNVKSLLLGCFKKLSKEDQLENLEKMFTKYDFNVLNSPDPEGFTEIFNKISSGENLESDLYCYILQAPLKTVTKICELCISNPKQLDFTLQMLIKPACDLENFYSGEEKITNPNLITHVLKNLINFEEYSSKEKQNLSNLITNLLKRKLIDFKFVEKILENIRIEIINGNLTKANFNLEILKSSLKVKDLEYNGIVLLAFMSQVLGHLSWDWTSFTSQRVEGRELTVSIISFLLKGLENVNEDAQLVWLRQEILKSDVVNQIYFCDLWLKYDRFFPGGDDVHVQFLILLNTRFKLQGYLEFVSGIFEKKKSFEVRSLIVLALVKILPILTAKEWITLFTHLKSIVSTNPSHFQGEDINIHVLDFFIAALYILGLVTNQNRDGYPCFEFCVRNFGRLTQEIITSKKSLGPDAYLRLLKGITFFLRGIETTGERESCSVILSPIILTSVDCIKNNEGDADDENILLWVSLLNVNDVEKAVRNKVVGVEQSCVEN